MKTNQIMERKFYGSLVRQRTKDAFFCATDLLTHYNNFHKNTKKKKGIDVFMGLQGTQEYMEELKIELFHNTQENGYLQEVYTSQRGKNGGTWMHPYLFIKFAMWLSPKFEVYCMKWIYDNLLGIRNEAGDYYNQMCETISIKYSEVFRKKPDQLVFVKEANLIRDISKTRNKKRNELTEEELETITKLQKANAKYIEKGYSREDRIKKLQEIFEMGL